MNSTAEAYTFHSTIHLLHISLINIYNCRDKMEKNTYLGSEAHPTTSYVAATFHPTIGQCVH